MVPLRCLPPAACAMRPLQHSVCQNFGESTFHEGGCMKWREALTVRFDVTPARTEGSLAVTQGLVVAVNGLDLVEAWAAIYVIHPVGVARVDKVVAVARVHLVVAVAGDDLVVALAAPEVVVAAIAFEAVLPAVALEAVGPAATLEAVLPVATGEAVGPVGPHEGILAAGAGKDLRQVFVPGEERSHHHYYQREQDV